MKSQSIGINKWAGNLAIEMVGQSGQGDQRLIGWRREDGALAIEGNGDPWVQDEPGFYGVWRALTGEAAGGPMPEELAAFQE